MKWKLKSGYYHKQSSNQSIRTKKQFREAIKGKKLYLFGGGNGADYFLQSYGHKWPVEGIIDNNQDLQGTTYWGIAGNRSAQIPIIGLEMLHLDITEGRNDFFILITSLKYYLEIAKQLESYFMTQYACLVDLEYSKIGAPLYRVIDTFMIATKRHYVTYYNQIGEKYLGDTYGWASKRKKYKKDYKKEPICNNKLVVYDNATYNEHPKYIVEYMIRHKLPIDVVWITKNLSDRFPKEIRVILEADTKQVMYELASAKVWISAFGLPVTCIKRKGQYYINTKHWSSVTMKKFQFDDTSHIQDKRNQYVATSLAKQMDYIVVGSAFDERTCRSGYRSKAKFLHFGSARSDILFHGEEQCQSIRERILGIHNQKIILYAPTFRRELLLNDSSELKYRIDLDFEEFLSIAENYYQEGGIILLKLHPVIQKYTSAMHQFPDQVIDVSNYDDIQELILIADMVITDYSSLMFEPMYIKKPVFLYATDKEAYIEKERGFLFEFDELPFSFATSMEELEEHIYNFNQEEYGKEIDAFMERLGVQEDGHASERTANFIYGLMKEE